MKTGRVLRWLLSVLGLSVLGASHAALGTLALVPEEGTRFEAAYFGIHIHNEGRQRNWPDIPVGSLRLWDADVGWAYLEQRPGQWDFSRLDEYMAWAHARQVEVLLALGVTPRWASARPDEAGAYGQGTAAEPADLERWRQYVRKVAQRYRGRIAAYQVGNEANEPMFFSGTVPALVQMARVAAEEVRRIDPAARLVAPSAVGLDQRVAWPSIFLAQGGAAAVDVAAFHLYHSGQPPEAVIAPVRTLRAAQAAAGFGALPLWNTEAGYWMPNTEVRWSADEQRNAISEELAAEYLPRDLLLTRALGFERFYWYAWDGAKMGLLDPATRTHRTPARVYAQTVRALTGSQLKRCDRSASGLWTCALRDAAGKPFNAVWLDPGATLPLLRLDVPAMARWLALDGRSGWRQTQGSLSVGRTVMLVEQP